MVNGQCLMVDVEGALFLDIDVLIFDLRLQLKGGESAVLFVCRSSNYWLSA